MKVIKDEVSFVLLFFFFSLFPSILLLLVKEKRNYVYIV